MDYLTSLLGVMVVLLAYLYRRLWLATHNIRQHGYFFSVTTEPHELRPLLAQHRRTLWGIGELFDDIGVALEHTSHRQAAADLKRLGAILRSSTHRAGSAFDVPWATEELDLLARRYAIKPANDGKYTIEILIAMGERILTAVVPQRGVLPLSD